MPEDLKGLRKRRGWSIEEFKVSLSKLTIPLPGSGRAGWYDARADYTWLCCEWCGQ